VVPTEWNAVARGRKFADEGCAPADQPEPPGSLPAKELNACEQECGQEDEDIGPEKNGLKEQGNELHRG
jgi:hypothetical protein